MKNVTKEKGDIGVGFVIADLLSKGIQVCIPISEHLPFDLVAYYPDGSLKRVSVKYRKVNKHGTFDISFRSVYSNSKGAHVKKLDKDLVDLFAVYCPDTNQVYYFNHKLYKGSVFFRITGIGDSRNRNRIRLAKYFLSPFVV